jgi:predicted amidohydrolase
MKIALCQTPILWESPSENLRNFDIIVDKIIEQNSGTDIIIFPEFFSVGFSMNRTVSESLDGASANWLRNKSSETGIAFLASVPIKSNEKIFNRAIFVTPEGFEYYYDKRHLFSVGGEDKIFFPGTSRLIVPFKGWNIMVQICYDLRFPVWSRNIELEYDLVINIANWPSSRTSVIEPMVRSRAIENLSYYAFVNRTGNDPENSYDGCSMVSDFKGTTLNPLIYDTANHFLIFEIDLNLLKTFRNKFPVWKDADRFSIEK